MSDEASHVARYERVTQGRVADMMLIHKYGEYVRYSDHAAALAAAEGRVNQRSAAFVREHNGVCVAYQGHPHSCFNETLCDWANKTLAAAPPQAAGVKAQGVTWTDVRPAKSGWYWQKDDEGACEVVFVDNIREVFQTMDAGYLRLDDFVGQWSSHPLVPPTGGE